MPICCWVHIVFAHFCFFSFLFFFPPGTATAGYASPAVADDFPATSAMRRASQTATPRSGQQPWSAASAPASSPWPRHAKRAARSWPPAHVSTGPGSAMLPTCKGLPRASRSVRHLLPAAAPSGRNTRFWEGGKGQRDPNKLDRNDARRYRNKRKTQSAKAKRVGAAGKARREHAQP
jgi:hypothetical protein